MAAGVFGYMGYDMVRLMEDLPEPNPDTLGLPDAVLIRPTIMAIFDSVRDEVTVTSPVYPEQGGIRHAPPMPGRRSGSAKSSMRSTGRSTISRCATRISRRSARRAPTRPRRTTRRWC